MGLIDYLQIVIILGYISTVLLVIYYGTRAILTICETAMDAGQASVRNLKFNFKEKIIRHWTDKKNWPKEWAKMML